MSCKRKLDEDGSPAPVDPEPPSSSTDGPGVSTAEHSDLTEPEHVASGSAADCSTTTADDADPIAKRLKPLADLEVVATDHNYVHPSDDAAELPSASSNGGFNGHGSFDNGHCEADTEAAEAECSSSSNVVTSLEELNCSILDQVEIDANEPESNEVLPVTSEVIVGASLCDSQMSDEFVNVCSDESNEHVAYDASYLSCTSTCVQEVITGHDHIDVENCSQSPTGHNDALEDDSMASNSNCSVSSDAMSDGAPTTSSSTDGLKGSESSGDSELCDGLSRTPVRSALKQLSESKTKKSVAFQGVRVYYFPRSQGFTCVPSQGGSTLGMTTTHFTQKDFTLDGHAEEKKRSHRDIIIRQRKFAKLYQKQHNGSTSESEEASDDDLSDISDSELEMDSCYFLQPVPIRQRRALLRASGVKRIGTVASAVAPASTT